MKYYRQENTVASISRWRLLLLCLCVFFLQSIAMANSLLFTIDNQTNTVFSASVVTPNVRFLPVLDGVIIDVNSQYTFKLTSQDVEWIKAGLFLTPINGTNTGLFISPIGVAFRVNMVIPVSCSFFDKYMCSVSQTQSSSLDADDTDDVPSVTLTINDNLWLQGMSDAFGLGY